MRTTTRLAMSIAAIMLVTALGRAFNCGMTSEAAPATAVTDDIPESIAGKVLLPDGKPAAGAPVTLFWHKPLSNATASSDGSFKLELDVKKIREEVGEDWPRMAVASALPGSGPGWEIVGRIKKADSVTLQLVEDVPISGKILDQQGRPILGANITILNMHRAKDENLDGFLKANRDNPTKVWLYERDSMYYLSPEAMLKLLGVKDQRQPTAATDENGHFTFSGFGKERSLFASVEGRGFTRESFYIATRPVIDSRWKRGQPSRDTRIMLESGASMPSVYAATFHHLAAPALSIHGKLTDSATGEPVFGMNVLASMRGATTASDSKSDNNGLYEISGLPLEGKLRISALNPGKLPYLDARIEMNVAATKQPEAIDFQLDRGIRVTGQVIDKRTGEGVAGNIGYLSWPNNESLRALHQPFDTFNTMATDKSGNYSIVVPFGPGVLTFNARDRAKFDVAVPDDFGLPVQKNGMFASGNRRLVMAQHFHYLKKIEPKVNDTSLQIDIAIGQGEMQQVHVTNSEGGSIEELEARGLVARTLSGFRNGNFQIPALQPNEKRIVFLRGRDREHAGVIELNYSARSTNSPLQLKLERSATVSGRITDDAGRPLSRWRVAAVSVGTIANLNKAEEGGRMDGIFEFDDTTTDADGYFRLKGLPPGISMEIAAALLEEDQRMKPVLVTTATLRPGRQEDLGLLKIAK